MLLDVMLNLPVTGASKGLDSLTLKVTISPSVTELLSASTCNTGLESVVLIVTSMLLLFSSSISSDKSNNVAVNALAVL